LPSNGGEAEKFTDLKGNVDDFAWSPDSKRIVLVVHDPDPREPEKKEKEKKTVPPIQLTDGGIYDNLGVQVLEPDRPPAFTFHACACDYLIVCNAGHGQFADESVPARLLPRLSTAFAVTHRQVQDATMHRLHHLREAKIIKGFALPYLGQQDDALPWQPRQLVPRSKVMAYPTDFRAMSEESINTLSDRGEQLTRVLVSHYLPQLLEPS
jgi:NTE family protein